ncbi:MAG: DUF503 domain-containing protein [Archangium sp.]|nr:DUF503 domain-containing protein [Archangium sp.]MDP3157603.1 DUF503 domain-containing protein [Archangium sp.]MDP3572003.1 DUF503 domain-containing protein [Archangium sp.]
MFVCVSRVTLDIPAAGSLKAKRQVVRRVTDRVKAKFNVAVAEVDDNDALNRAVVAMSVVGNDRSHVNEMMDKIFQYIDDMYVAPVSSREFEILSFGEDLFQGPPQGDLLLTIPRGERSLAEAEGLGAWEDRHSKGIPPPSPSSPAKKAPKKKEKEVNLTDARAVARSLRNRREWEKE